MTDSRLRSAGRAAAVGVVLALALAGCTQSDPTLLDESDVDGVVEASGLNSDTVGWRTENYDGHQGELAVIRLDDARLLVVGLETDEAEPPIELDELIRLAREGAAQFEGDAE